MNRNSVGNQIQVHLEEYKVLKAEINSRLAHQDRLLHWSLIFFAGMSGLLFGFTSTLNALIITDLRWILLLVPLVFIAINFDYQSQYFMMAHLARYLNLVIRPRICFLLNLPETEAMAWEDYLHESREQSGTLERLAWNARYIIIFTMALLWWLFFILVTLVYYKIPWNVADWTLVLIAGLTMIVLLCSNIPIIRLFRQVPIQSSKTKGVQNGLRKEDSTEP